MVEGRWVVLEGVAVGRIQENFEKLNEGKTPELCQSSWPSSHCFLCFGGCFLLSGMTRVAAGASPDFRATRRASLPASMVFFLRFFIPGLSRDSSAARN